LRSVLLRTLARRDMRHFAGSVAWLATDHAWIAYGKTDQCPSFPKLKPCAAG
jgi:hypothetical protein